MLDLSTVLVTHGLVTTALVAGTIWCAVPRTIPLQVNVWVRQDADDTLPTHAFVTSGDTDAPRAGVLNAVDADDEPFANTLVAATADTDWVSTDA